MLFILTENIFGNTCQELGLASGTPVSSSLIDAHAGALGMLAGAGNDYLGRLGLATYRGSRASRIYRVCEGRNEPLAPEAHRDEIWYVHL